MTKELLKPVEVMKMCKLSKTATYELFHSEGFPLIILGKNTLRVDKEDLYRYLEQKKITL